MTTSLVTGGAGFIGSHIATALVERGDRVRVLDDLSSGRRENLAHLEGRVEWLVGDANDPATAERAVDGCAVVYHQAALASVPASVRDPLAAHAACVTATVNVLNAARSAGVQRVVFASTAAAYGDAPFSAKRESDALIPLSPYAAAKIASEHYCRAFTETFGLETVSLRYFNVYGPRQDPASEYAAVIPIFVTQMLNGKRPTVFGDGLQSRDFVYVDDVARANLLAADAHCAVGRSINIASGVRVTLRDLLAALNKLLGTHVEAVYTGPRQGDVRESLADISLARELLGYEPAYDLSAGLSRSIEFYRSVAAER